MHDGTSVEIEGAEAIGVALVHHGERSSASALSEGAFVSIEFIDRSELNLTRNVLTNPPVSRR